MVDLGLPGMMNSPAPSRQFFRIPIALSWLMKILYLAFMCLKTYGATQNKGNR